MNVIIYARCAIDSRLNIEKQLETCREFAKVNNFNIVDEYIDRDSSGMSNDRPNFQRMIADSAKKKFQAVLVYQLDRFFRNRYDAVTYKVKLRENGVKVISAVQSRSNNSEGTLIKSLLEGMAEHYSQELSRKTRAGIQASRAKKKERFDNEHS